MSEYDTDILTWSEHQAELLRQHAAGTRANDNTAIDWPNIIEEIEAVGQSQVDQVESWLFQMAVHLLKAEAWPLSLTVPHWQAEARGFRAQARRNIEPAWRRRSICPACMPTPCRPCRTRLTAPRPCLCRLSARGRWKSC